LYLAWEMLDPELQHAWAQIGALPAFAAYHESTLAALWEIPVERVSGWRTVFCQDSGLCQAAGKHHWRIHEQAWRFAKAQFARLPGTEKQHAAGWLERQVQIPEFLNQYQRLLKESKDHSFVAWTPYARHFDRSVFRRLGRSMLEMGYWVPEWDVIAANPAQFSSDIYAVAYLHQKKDRQLRTPVFRLAYLILALGVVSVVLWGLNSIGFLHAAGLMRVQRMLGWASILLIPVWLVLSVWMLVRAAAYERFWRYLWERNRVAQDEGEDDT
jgi:hypothetical protein